MNPIIKEITASQVKKDIPPFKVGDGVRVHTKVREGEKERIQIFSGIVIARKGHGIHELSPSAASATARGSSACFRSIRPNIEKIEVERESEAMRRASTICAPTGKAAVAVSVKQRRGSAAVPPAAPAAARPENFRRGFPAGLASGRFRLRCPSDRRLTAPPRLAASRSTPSTRPAPAISAFRSVAPRSAPCSMATPWSTTPTSPAGSTATASFFRPDMVRCSSTPGCT